MRISQAELKRLHEKRMRKVLDIAAAEGNEVVILGAFGCGAFCNPPGVVAAAMKTVVEEYRYQFQTIEFAVYCSPRDDENYRVFQRVGADVKRFGTYEVRRMGRAKDEKGSEEI